MRSAHRRRRDAAFTSSMPTKSKSSFSSCSTARASTSVTAAAKASCRSRRWRSPIAIVTLNESRLLARKLSDLAAKDVTTEPDQAFVLLAFEQILGRDPIDRRTDRVPRLPSIAGRIAAKTDKLTAIAGGAKATVAASADPNQRARENLTLVLFNHNDFVTIH